MDNEHLDCIIMHVWRSLDTNMSLGRRAGIGSHTKPNKGITTEWLTPPEVVSELGLFHLDPCSPINRPWDTAKVHYTRIDDGLSKPWWGRVWCNPPYDQNLSQWIRRMINHGDGIMLLFARTEIADFRLLWRHADGFLFLFKRLSFYHVDGTKAKGNAGGPSVLIAFGEDNSEILQKCKLEGAYLPKATITGVLDSTIHDH